VDSRSATQRLCVKENILARKPEGFNRNVEHLINECRLAGMNTESRRDSSLIAADAIRGNGNDKTGNPEGSLKGFNRKVEPQDSAISITIKSVNLKRV